jgi:adenylosuccinate lyase
MNEIVKGMIAGYGPDFPSLEELFALKADAKTIETLSSPTSLLGRYSKSVEFMKDITSGKAIGLKRFYVIKQYLIALSDFLEKQPIPHDEKIIAWLNDVEKNAIMEKIGVSLDEVVQAEKIEAFTEHDTAAAGDFIKLKIASELPHLARYAEAVCFAETSEDTMSIVFGLIANELILGHLSNRLIDFCIFLLNYCDLQEKEIGGPLVLPELTHLQAAEPTSHRIKSLIRVRAIKGMLHDLLSSQFSAKMGGAIGNLTCHYAAYPELPWHDFAKKYIEDYKLTYEPWTDQCVSYANEAGKFLIVANILTQVIKLTEDFIRMASCPAQLFVKQKKKGAKGSSIMPNKSNAWGMEGGVAMLKKARNALIYLAEELPNYPNAGNMGRSFLFRELGTDVMPIFIALDRITREMKSYVPCKEKIEIFLQEYPGISGSALQTVLKRMRIPGDAYRAIQDIAVNSDGSYANQNQFSGGLARKITEFSLSETQAAELQKLVDPKFLIMPAHQKALSDNQEMLNSLDYLQTVAKGYIN